MAKAGGNYLYTFVIKDGMPTVDEARAKLLTAVRDAPRKGYKAMKLVHGYGSSGTGGTLKNALRASLRKRRKEGRIAGFVGGEKWHVNEADAQKLLELCPQLERDDDLNMFNEGITVVVF